MKFLSTLTLVTVLGATSAFVTPQVKPIACETKLYGLFDFKTFHGGGSAGESDLDEQWEAQQEILRRRRGGSGTKDHLKKKYSHRSVEEPAKSVRQAKSIKVEKPNEENSTPSRPKFFWEQ